MVHKFPRRTATWIFLLRFAATVAPTNAIRPFVDSAFIGKDDGGSSSYASIGKLRGGAPSFEPNPNYQSNNSPTLGDVDNNGFYRVSTTFQSPLQNNGNRRRPPPLIQSVGNYFAALREHSPTLFHGTVASVVLFLVWQLPSSFVSSVVLRNHFVTSSYNVIRKRRIHALVLSAFSHASFRHVALNLYAFVMFGRSVKQVLQSHGLELWPFVISAAVFGNLVFLLLDGGQGSCLGLSGVTLALLAFDALVYPTKELRLFVSFIPITLPAYYLFLGLVGFSVLGMFGLAGRSNVAHSTHLGGLLYGFLFYEAFKRGWPRQWNYRLRKTYRALRNT